MASVQLSGIVSQIIAKDRDRPNYENSATHIHHRETRCRPQNAVGDIIEQFEKNDFRILAMKMLEISKHQAEQFYAVHAARPFFNTLTDFMSSGPIVVLALEKENAIADLRKLMGATNPAQGRGGHDPQEVGDQH